MSGNSKKFAIIRNKLHLVDSNGQNEEVVDKIQFNNETVFELNEKLGSGSYGTVFSAKKYSEYSTYIDNLAIKFSPIRVSGSHERELAINNIIRESKIPLHNIVISLGSTILNNGIFLLFMKLDKTLSAVLYENGCMQLYAIRAVIKQICLVLCHLELIGMLHTDLKSSNIMLVNHASFPYFVKVIDFGLASHPSYENGRQRVHEPQVMTMRAPEVLLGSRNYSKIDVWSVGYICLQLLLDVLFFDSEGEEESKRAILYNIYQLLGQPVAELNMPMCHFYFNEDGTMNMTDGNRTSHEKRERNIPTTFAGIEKYCIQHSYHEQDVKCFIDFLKCVLTWTSEERITGTEAAKHSFLSMEHLVEDKEYYEKSLSVMKSALILDVCLKKEEGVARESDSHILAEDAKNIPSEHAASNF